MDDIFDDGFDIEDATLLAGAIGFAEESIRAEEEGEKDEEETTVVEAKDLDKIDLRLIYNMNPKLFNYVAGIVQRQRAKWRRDKLRREIKEEVVDHELEAMAKTEALLGKGGSDVS